MKKGYKRLMILEFMILFLLFLNSFVSSIMSRYQLVVYLIVVLGILKVHFGIEKDRHRYTKDIILEGFIYLLVFFLFYYLLGLIVTFARTENYLNITGFINYIIPIIAVIVLKEVVRYQLLQKAEGSKLLLVMTCIVFIGIDISNAIYYNDFGSKYGTFLFVALSLLPAISRNIVSTYISKKTGYKPVIIYLLITSLYGYIMPIVPNPSEYIVAMVEFLLPVGFGYKVYRFYEREKDREIQREYNKRKLVGLIIPTGIIVVLVYFVSGYFHYYAVAVASGSMSPEIKKGDVVIIEKLEGKYDELKEGQVIAYKYDDILIVHRLERILKSDGKYYFYTKGDANTKEDNWTVEEEMIIGTVNYKISYIGLPTVWLNEL